MEEQFAHKEGEKKKRENKLLLQYVQQAAIGLLGNSYNGIHFQTCEECLFESFTNWKPLLRL